MGLGLLAIFGLNHAASTALATEVDARQEPQEYVEPIVTEQTIPNAVGDWDLRVSAE